MPMPQITATASAASVPARSSANVSLSTIRSRAHPRPSIARSSIATSDGTSAMGYYRPLYKTDLTPEPAAIQAVIDAEDEPAARTLRPADVTDPRIADTLRASGFFASLPQ